MPRQVPTSSACPTRRRSRSTPRSRPSPKCWRSAILTVSWGGGTNIGSPTVLKPGGIPSTTVGHLGEPGGGAGGSMAKLPLDPVGGLVRDDVNGAGAVISGSAKAESTTSINNGAFAFFEDIPESNDVASQCEAVVTIYSQLPGQSNGNRTGAWNAVIADNTLFIKVPDYIDWEGNGFGFKECIVAVMELAEDVLECESLVVCLQKSRHDLTSLLRAFMFVGFEVVHPSVYNFGDKYVLVGTKL